MTDLEEVRNMFDSLFNQYKIDKKVKYEIEFGIMPNHMAQDISSIVGFNIIGAKLRIDSEKVSHILIYHDGITETERVKEEKRGQIPVKKEDFYLIHKIILECDEYKKARDDQYGNPGIYFIKILNNIHYQVCLTYTQKRDRRTDEIKKKLTVSTMFKKKI